MLAIEIPEADSEGSHALSCSLMSHPVKETFLDSAESSLALNNPVSGGTKSLKPSTAEFIVGISLLNILSRTSPLTSLTST